MDKAKLLKMSGLILAGVWVLVLVAILSFAEQLFKNLTPAQCEQVSFNLTSGGFGIAACLWLAGYALQRKQAAEEAKRKRW